MRIFILFIFLFLLNSCRHIPRESEERKSNEWAGGFNLSEYPGFSVLDIYDPWQQADDYSFRYVLLNQGINLPDSLHGLPAVHCPVQRIIVLSTTHIGYISALNEQESIVGISGKNYVYDSALRKKIASGKVTDIGHTPALDYEKIVEMNPDVVLLYGLESSIVGVVDRLAEAGIPSMIIGEYLESHPLAKMEWLKVIAALYGKSEMADSIFRKRSSDYLYWKKKILNTDQRPEVLVGMPWKDTWYMAGGNSYTAKLIEDAGGHYLWHEDSSDEYIPLNLESAFMGALNADFWVNTGSAGSLNDIRGADQRFKLLDVVRQENVYNNNRRINRWGGNDFWESGVVHPELILKDLIKIFHPGQIESHDFVYYRKLE